MRYPLSSATAIEMCYYSKTTMSTVSGTLAFVIIVVQFAKYVPDALSYDPPTTIVVNQSLEASVPAFTNLFPRFKMEYLPVGNIDANILFLHSSESSL